MPLVPGQAARRAVLDHHQDLAPALALEVVVGTAAVAAVEEEGTILVAGVVQVQVGEEDTPPTRLS